MKRVKKHKIKDEIPESSTFKKKDNEEHDLAYYIHDRVELMHQVFSIIRMKELKEMIPRCVKNIPSDSLQELCTEELLGISSKRLCAILDGADPPSDTETSCSSENLETISLDSISSDEEILSQHSSKGRKHKHRKRNKSKSKHKKRDLNKDSDSGEDISRASRAGLTVLELLELQARARAIRAQLQKDQAQKRVSETVVEAADSSDGEVEIKEEPSEVVEISSEDEKPKVEELEKQIHEVTATTTKEQEKSKTITKHINDLVITVPQTKQTRKIKLTRNKVVSCETPKVAPLQKLPLNNAKESIQLPSSNENIKSKDAKKNKTKKKSKQKNNRNGSDHDEITLQLSDTEKMDLLEDLDRKNYDSVSSSSKDSENSSDSDITNNSANEGIIKEKLNKKVEKKIGKSTELKNKTVSDKHASIETTTNKTINEEYFESISINQEQVEQTKTVEIENGIKKDNIVENCLESITLESSNENQESHDSDGKRLNTSQIDGPNIEQNDSSSSFHNEILNKSLKNDDVNKKDISSKENGKQHLSDGELSDNTSSVVCISDDERTKKKKFKKSKKKSKKTDSVKATDESLYKKVTGGNVIQESVNTDILIIDNNKNDNEILELSDDSSCYEVDGVSILSKEPTSEEIEALSAKIDDIGEDVISDEQINEHEILNDDHTDAENISWKDRYLDSKKVKRVLKSSNILNAIRKKNRELKKKLEESKKVTISPKMVEEPSVVGTIEEYNTLEGSTKYVDPISDEVEDKEEELTEEKVTVTKDIEKDAKQLLKMYKKLMKYNDMNRKKDPNRKKKKKSKKNKDKHKEKIEEISKDVSEATTSG